MEMKNIPMPPGVEIRLARPEDYQGVMDINRNIDSGLDYLLTKYMKYMTDPNRVCFLVRKDGRTIGFGIHYIVDGGKTIVKQAGRIHADFQGQGYSRLLDLVWTKGQDKVEQQMWMNSNREASEGVIKRHREISMVAVRFRFSLDFSPLELELALKKPEFQEFQKWSQKYNTVTLTPSTVKEVMSSFPQDVAAIVPEGFWVVDWQPYQPMTSNYDLITKDSTVYVTMTTNGGLLAVSYGTPVEVKVGLRYRADYYVHPEQANNQELFFSHLTRHLIQVHQFYRGKNISFSILYPHSVAAVGSNVKKHMERKLGLSVRKTLETPCFLLKREMSKKPSAQL